MHDGTDRRVHVALTGACGGIGRALSRELAQAGYALTLVGRQRTALERLASELGTVVHVAEMDLLDRGHLADWIPASEAALGAIDVLINGAGAVAAGPFTEIPAGVAWSVAQVDLLAPLALMAAVLPGMLARRSGTLVNIASTGALAPNPGMVHYCAAKAGLAAASESLRGELRRSGVDVVTVYPGPIPTEMLRAAHVAYPRTRLVTDLPSGVPDELARRIRIAIQRRHARVIYPRIYSVFRYLPWVVRILLDRLTPAPLSLGIPCVPTEARRP